MKKVIAVLLAFVMCLSLAGCSGGTVSQKEYDDLKSQLEEAEKKTEVTPTPEPTPSPDQTILNDMKSALQKRWDINSSKTTEQINSMSNTEYIEYTKSFVNAELEILDKYKNLVFNDVKLDKLVKDYIGTLEKQIEAMKYYTADFIEYDKLWKEAYDSRTTILNDVISEYGLSFDEKYKSIVEELTTNAQVVGKKTEQKESIAEIEKQVDFQNVENENAGDWKDYETVLENTTDCTFDYYQLEISLLDSDGVIIGSAYGNSINNWKPGEKAKIKFTTNENFESLKWTARYYVAE